MFVCSYTLNLKLCKEVKEVDSLFMTQFQIVLESSKALFSFFLHVYKINDDIDDNLS